MMNASNPTATHRSTADGLARAKLSADTREAEPTARTSALGGILPSIGGSTSLAGRVAQNLFLPGLKAGPAARSNRVGKRRPTDELTPNEEIAIDALVREARQARRWKPWAGQLMPEELFGTPRAGSPFFDSKSLKPDKAAQDRARAVLATDELLLPWARPTDSPPMDRISMMVERFGIDGATERGKLTDDIVQCFARFLTMAEPDPSVFERPEGLDRFVGIEMDHLALHPSSEQKVRLAVCRSAINRMLERSPNDIDAMRRIVSASSLDPEAEKSVTARVLSFLEDGIQRCEEELGESDGRRLYIKAGYDTMEDSILKRQARSGGVNRPMDVEAYKEGVRKAMRGGGTGVDHAEGPSSAAHMPPPVRGLVPLRSGGAAVHAAFENAVLTIRDVLQIDPNLVREAVAQSLEATIAFEVRHGGLKRRDLPDELMTVVRKTLRKFERRIDHEFGSERPEALRFGDRDHLRELTVRGLEALIHHGMIGDEEGQDSAEDAVGEDRKAASARPEDSPRTQPI